MTESVQITIGALVLHTCIGSALTLYMLALLIRWTAPWLELDLRKRYLQWLPRITDPLINLMRRLLPPMGPMDWGPVAAVIAVWILRLIIVQY